MEKITGEILKHITSGITLVYGQPYTFKTKIALYIASYLNGKIYYIANGKHKRKKLASNKKIFKTNSFIEETYILFNLDQEIENNKDIIIWDTFLGNYAYIEAYLDSLSSLKILILALTQLKYLSKKHNIKIILIELEDQNMLPPLWKYIQPYINIVIHTVRKNNSLKLMIKTSNMETIKKIDIPIGKIL